MKLQEEPDSWVLPKVVFSKELVLLPPCWEKTIPKYHFERVEQQDKDNLSRGYIGPLNLILDRQHHKNISNQFVNNAHLLAAEE